MSAREYPSGYFTALMREHNWPKGFVPAMPRMRDEFTEKRAAAARRGREVSIAENKGYGDGTIKNFGSKKGSA